MASEKARRDVQGFGQKGKSYYQLHSQPAKVGGLEFASGANIMQQEHMEKDRDTKRDKQSSSVAQATVGEERIGGVKAESHGKEHKVSDIKKNTQMQKQEGDGKTHRQEGGAQERRAPSLEEISQQRATAQQSSMKAAEERYKKAKELGAFALHEAKESASHGLGAAGYYATAKCGQAKDTVTQGVQTGTQYVADKAVAAKDTAIEKGAQAKDTIVNAAQIGSEYVADRAGAAKDSAVEKSQKAYAATKESLSSAGQTAVQSAQQSKDYTMQKAGETKDYATEKISTTAKSATHYAGEKATQAKQSAAELSKNTASYVGQKGVEAKDATVETGKSAVEYAGEVAETVKDKAKVAGLGVAHYTADKAAEATKAAAGVVSSVGGYAGDKAVAAKDVVVDAGMSAVGYAEDKLAAATDYVISAEESAADYAARERVEAERQLEGKNSKGGSGGGVFSGQELEEAEERKQLQEKGGGVLQAIGETIVEIGKSTKDFVAGGNQVQPGYDHRSGSQ